MRVDETGVHVQNVECVHVCADVGLLSHTDWRHIKFLSVAASLRGADMLYICVYVCVRDAAYNDAL